MNPVLVDSNVILDAATADPVWGPWSAEAVERLGDEALLVINPVIYAEVSAGYERIEEVDRVLPAETYHREPIPFPAAFLAGRAHFAYRRRGGRAPSPLPDFLIGAHAAVAGYRLLTRDPRRFRRTFPTVELIAP